MSSLVFTSNVGSAIKSGNYKPDSDGYYKIRAGTIGVPNTSGIVYEVTDKVKQLFSEDSPLMSRLNSGYLRSEQGHPKRTPGMTDKDYVRRILKIEETRFCGHIKAITVTEQSNRKGVFDVVIEIKPAGPFKDALEDDLSNPHSNTAFSIRSLVDQRIENGVIIRTLTTIVTWDFVDSPGIDSANKLNSIGLENDLLVIDKNIPEDVEILKSVLDEMSSVGTENDISLVSEIMHELTACKSGKCIYKDWK